MDGWQQITGTLLQAGLPALGGLFGGPLGSTVGGVVGTAIAGALGVKPTPQAVQQAIAADPSAASVKLAEIEAETKRRQAALEDVANARQMEVVAIQANHGIAWAPLAITVLNYVIFGGVVVCVAMGWLREDGIIVGFGLGAATAGYQYWLGSSESSKRNADTVRQITASALTPSPGQVAQTAIAATKRR